MATARSVFRNVRSAASRISGGAKPNAASSARSAFRIPSQKPLSHRIFRSPVEMSCVSVESMLPFHSATASALLTSMLSAPRTCGWTLEASHDHDIGDTQSSIEYSFLKKAGLSFMGTRGFCTSMLSSESSEGSFPSDLLSRKQIITSERAIGQLQDLVIPVTNFQNEDKGMMVLAGDVFNLPIRKDIVHRVVRSLSV